METVWMIVLLFCHLFFYCSIHIIHVRYIYPMVYFKGHMLEAKCFNVDDISSNIKMILHLKNILHHPLACL